MKNKTKSTQSSRRTRRIHICYGASISYMRLQKKIGLSITTTNLDTFRIVCEVHGSVFYSFITSGVVMLFVKHSILPSDSSTMTKRTWGFVGFKLVSIVSIFDKEVKMGIDVHVDDNWSIVHNVMVQVLKVLLWVSEFGNSVNKRLFSSVVKPLAFFVHIYHCLVLKFCAAIVCNISFFLEKLFPLVTCLIVNLLLMRFDLIVAKETK